MALSGPARCAVHVFPAATGLLALAVTCLLMFLVDPFHLGGAVLTLLLTTPLLWAILTVLLWLPYHLVVVIFEHYRHRTP